MHLYPEGLSQKVGFETIRTEAARAARSEMARERLARLIPYSDPERVERTMNLTREMIDLQLNDAAFPLDHLHDIRTYLKNCRAEGTLLPLESFREILQLTATARRVKSFLDDREDRYPALRELAVGLIPMPDLEDRIKGVIDEHGNLRNDASDKLRTIRKNLGKKRSDLRTAINRVMSRAQKEGYTSDEGPTIRGGRMVIPVLAEHKRKIQGFVHDVSSSGQTVYLEPVEALNINNEIRQMESEEKQEIERILRSLTDRVRGNREYLQQNSEVLGRIDMVSAKAHLSTRLEGAVPVLSNDRYIRLKEAHNPILLLKNLSLDEEQREPVIPLDLELETDERCLIITGPNAGGKSVAMKTLALCSLMMQAGFAIPAKDTSELPVFSGVFVDMGDDQSIENDLSTFSSRLEWMKHTVATANDRSLILIDEAGAGTDPDEGGALFQSLIEKLVAKKAIVLVTTHHGSLKAFAHDHPKAVNGSMEFDQSTLSPTYRFRKGIPGSSYAFEIAERMDLDPGLLDLARKIVGESKENLESLINELEQKSQEAEELKSKYDKLQARMEKERNKYEELRKELDRKKDAIREKALKQAQEIMESANQRIEDAVEKIVASGQKDDEAIREAREEVAGQKEEIASELEELESQNRQRKQEEISVERPQVGDTVRLMDAQTTGELVDLNDNQAVVLSGGLRLKTKYDKLVKVADAKQNKKKGDRITVNISGGAGRKPVKPSLNIRGMRGHEAMKEVMHYLDNAIASGLGSVDIIHGKGEGILKNLVHEYLQERDEVDDFHLATADRGGAGCTIVKLK